MGFTSDLFLHPFVCCPGQLAREAAFFNGKILSLLPSRQTSCLVCGPRLTRALIDAERLRPPAACSNTAVNHENFPTPSCTC